MADASLGRTSYLSGKLVVIAIAGLGFMAMAILGIYLEVIEGEVRERMERIRADLAAEEARPHLEGGLAGIREYLGQLGHLKVFTAKVFRERALPLLAHAYHDEQGEGAGRNRRAWLALLLAINAPESRPFFVKLAAAPPDPEAAAAARDFLVRHPE